MEVGEGIKIEWHGSPHYFCTDICRQRFADNPRAYLQQTCLVCRSENSSTPPAEESHFEATWQGQTYNFCTPAHRDAFRADPAGFFMHTMWGIPNWLYYASIGLILLLSFAVIEWRADRRDTSQESSYPRFDLLQFTHLRRLLTHPLTRFVLQALVVAFFALIIAAGLFGNQLPSKNIAPLLTWTVWWGGLILLILYAGKAWCYVCPWDAIAGWAEGLRFWGRKKEGLSLNLKWPASMRNI
jgi:YHS domain-containing protein